MENVYRQTEEHLYSLHCLLSDVKDIGHAILCSHMGIPTSSLNHAFRVQVPKPKAEKLIADVIEYYQSMKVNPCFIVSPATRPQSFADYLQQANFAPVLEESVMIYKGKGKSYEAGSDVNVVADDGGLLDVWTDVHMKAFKVPVVLRNALLKMYGKAGQYKGTKAYLGYFQGKPAGVCGLVSFNNVGGIFTVGTAPEYRRKGVATALLQKAIDDSLNTGNNSLYLITTKGSDAERLYMSLGFQVACTHSRYELQSQKQ